MRWTKLLLRTRRERPETSLPGLAYLLQGGFIRRAAAGLYDWGPLGHALRQQVVHYVQSFARNHELSQLQLVPFDAGEREDARVSPKPHYLPALLRWAEEHLTSYKQLPQDLLTTGPVHRAEPRPRGGLLRTKAFTLMEGLSLAHTPQDAHRSEGQWHQFWRELFRRGEIPTALAVLPDFSGYPATGYVWPHPSGDVTYLHCPTCDTWFHPDVAPFHLPQPEPEPLRPRAKVHTPDCHTIDALCAYLDIPPERTAKALFLVAGERVPLIVLVRGDMDLSEPKLLRVLGPTTLRAAREEEIREWGAEPGYGSPVGTEGALIIVDPFVVLTPNLVGGANEPEYHYVNLNVGRDFQPHIVADIARAPAHAMCPTCGSPYLAQPAWKLASVTQPALQRGLLVPPPEAMPQLKDLPARYPLPPYLGPDGRPTRPWVVHTVGGVDRLVGAVAETHHDERGLVWPKSMAPCDIHLILIPARKDPRVAQQASELYNALQAKGLRVLFDDRDERAGVKFNDADLLGCPVRVTISARTLRENAVEVRFQGTEPVLVPQAELFEHVRTFFLDNERDFEQSAW